MRLVLESRMRSRAATPFRIASRCVAALAALALSSTAAFAAPVKVTAKDAGGAVLATNVENVPLGTAARPVRLDGNAFVPISLLNAGNTSCTPGRVDTTPAGKPCAAGAAREWVIETGAVTNLPDVATLTVEVTTPGEVCDCQSTFAESQCCGAASFIATGSSTGGTHTLRFLLPPPSAGCKIVIDGGCWGSACAKLTANGSEAFLQLEDTDGNGRCEWPDGQTAIAGALHFTATTAVEFSGNTSIRAGEIIVDDGALLASVASHAFDAFAARDLELIAVDGSITTFGRLDLVVSDDLLLKAEKGDIALRGSSTLRAEDHATIEARRGDVAIDAPTGKPGDVFGGNIIEILARGPAGGIGITGHVHVGSRRRLTLSNRSYVSVVGTKELRLAGGVVLTTDQERTGVAGTSASDIELHATGPIVITGKVLIDSGRNIRIQTNEPGAQVCLADDVALEATRRQLGGGGAATGRILFPNGAAPVFDDGTTTFSGVVHGTVQPGLCAPVATPTAPTPTATLSPTPSATTAPTATATIELTQANWAFYVRIARTKATDINVHVPQGSEEPPIAQSMAKDQLSLFGLGNQVSGEDIAAAGGGTLGRLTAAVIAHIVDNPDDYPGFASVVGLVWAKRVAPSPPPTPTVTNTPVATATAKVSPTPAPILTPLPWRFYAQIAQTAGGSTNVHVPERATDAAIVAAIAESHAGFFRVSTQVTGADIARLGGDTASRLTSAIAEYIQRHPDDYPGFAAVVQIRWAERGP